MLQQKPGRMRQQFVATAIASNPATKSLPTFHLSVWFWKEELEGPKAKDSCWAHAEQVETWLTEQACELLVKISLSCEHLWVCQFVMACDGQCGQ